MRPRHDEELRAEEMQNLDAQEDAAREDEQPNGTVYTGHAAVEGMEQVDPETAVAGAEPRELETHTRERRDPAERRDFAEEGDLAQQRDFAEGPDFAERRDFAEGGDERVQAVAEEPTAEVPRADEAEPAASDLAARSDVGVEPRDIAAVDEVVPEPVQHDESLAGQVTYDRQGVRDGEMSTVDGLAAEGQAGDLPVEASLWSGSAAQDLRSRWQSAQLRFVDDPAAVAAEAKDLVGEAVRSLTDRLEQLDGWDPGETDTERLRQVVAQYRDLFDQLIPGAEQ